MNVPRLTMWICSLSLLGLAVESWAQGRSVNGKTFTENPSFTHPSVGRTLGQAHRDSAAARKASKGPVVMSFDTLPASPWQAWNCLDGGTATVSNGILAIDSPTCYEFDLWNPAGEWNQYVNNEEGWVIEARLKLDPITVPSSNQDRGAVLIWANDHVNLLIIGFQPNELRLAYPDYVPVAMNTTDDFHTYRIQSRLNTVQIYVDGVLRIDHVLSWSGGGSDLLTFGDGDGQGHSLSYWDYFMYDVTP